MTLSSYNMFAWCRQGNTAALTYGTPKNFVVTTTGDKETIHASNAFNSFEAGAGARSKYVGYWVEVVRCANGPTGERGAPIRRRVIAYDSSADTVYVEELPFSTAVGDVFTFLKPWNAWIATYGYMTTAALLGGTVSSATSHISSFYSGTSTEAEAGGPYVTVVDSSSVPAATNATIGIISTVNYSSTDFYGFTTSLTVAPSTNELFEVWEYPEVFSGLPVPLAQNRLERKPVTGVSAPLRGAAGVREGGGTIELAFRGPGTGREGKWSELDLPLGSVLDPVSTASTIVKTFDNRVDLVEFTSTPVLGGMYCTENGDVFVASAVASLDVTPSPNLRQAPGWHSAITGLRKYTESSDLNYSIACLQWHGKGVRDHMFGCVPNISFSGARGEYLKCSIDLKVADFIRVNKDRDGSALSRGYNAKPSTITPRCIGDSRVNIAGVEFEARAFSVDLGLDAQQKTNLGAPNRTDGFRIVKFEPTFTADLYLDADSKSMLERYLYGAGVTVLIQSGNSVGEPGVFAFWAKECELTATEIGDENGFITVQVQGRVTYDATSSLDPWMIGIG